MQAVSDIFLGWHAGRRDRLRRPRLLHPATPRLERLVRRSRAWCLAVLRVRRSLRRPSPGPTPGPGPHRDRGLPGWRPALRPRPRRLRPGLRRPERARPPRTARRDRDGARGHGGRHLSEPGDQATHQPQCEAEVAGHPERMVRTDRHRHHQGHRIDWRQRRDAQPRIPHRRLAAIEQQLLIDDPRFVRRLNYRSVARGSRWRKATAAVVGVLCALAMAVGMLSGSGTLTLSSAVLTGAAWWIFYRARRFRH